MLSRNTLNKGVPLLLSTLSSSIKKANITQLALQNFGMRDKLYKSIELEVKSFEPAVLRSYVKFIRTAANYFDIGKAEARFPNKPRYHRFNALKSAFGHRKHIVQYEIRTHYRWLLFRNLTGSTADTFLEYLERMLPEGVGLKVTKTCLEPLPDHLNVQESQEEIKQ